MSLPLKGGSKVSLIRITTIVTEGRKMLKQKKHKKVKMINEYVFSRIRRKKKEKKQQNKDVTVYVL